MPQKASNNNWPLPKYYFIVTINGKNCSFQEISGLESETQVIEYRDSNSKQFSTIKTPGITKSRIVTLKKGIFVKDNDLFSWFSSINLNTIQRLTVVINLLDEARQPVVTWTLLNAWPTKITGLDLTADGNEVVLGLMELAYEGLVMAMVEPQ